MKELTTMFIGVAFCAVIAIAATWLAGIQHFVGGPIIGMVLGILAANTFGARFSKMVKKGAAFSSKMVLRLGIILTGGTLSFATIVGAGSSALPYILLSIGLAFTTACLVGKYFMKVSTNTRLLVASGTSICGGTAIATIAAVLDADEDETAYAMTAIFLFDMLAALLWPYVALALKLEPGQFSILAGIAINDVASVTAVGATYDSLMGAAAVAANGVSGGELAVIVKLTRVVMLVFVALGVMIWKIWDKNRKNASVSIDKHDAVKKIAKAFPIFIIGFFALALANTFIDFTGIAIGGSTVAALLKIVNKYLITVALVGVGCKVNLRDLFRKGFKPVLLGGCTWLVVAVLTLMYVILLY